MGYRARFVVCVSVEDGWEELGIGIGTMASRPNNTCVARY